MEKLDWHGHVSPFRRGLLLAAAIGVVLAAVPLLSQETARGQLSLPDRPAQPYSVTIGRGGEGGVEILDFGQPGTATTFAGPSGGLLASAGAGGGGTFNESGAPV